MGTSRTVTINGIFMFDLSMRGDFSCVVQCQTMMTLTVEATRRSSASRVSCAMLILPIKCIDQAPLRGRGEGGGILHPQIMLEPF